MSEPATATADARRVATGRFSQWVSTLGIFGVALLLVLLGAGLQGGHAIRGFLTARNFLNIVDAVSLLGIVAVGMAFVTYSGHYADLSAPTTMALTGIVAVETLRFGFWPAMAAAVVVGLAIGGLNALVVGRFRANPILWTLAVNYVTLGVVRVCWANKQIYPDVQTGSAAACRLFEGIYRFRLFDTLGLPTLLLLALVVAGQWVLTATPFGVQLKFTGSAPRAARFTGIHTERVIGLAFVIAAFTATVGGLAVTSLSRVGAWYNGAGYDFKAVTAIVVGGMTLAGGRGSIVGVLGGVLVIGLMNNIMTLLGIGTFSQDMIRGAIFILVVGGHAASLRRLGRDDT